jgi:2-keto-4-pentenoate hydratase/2-oxohepta-3-ene-1,7-dioic acid hydratase in catechol pathway
MRIASALHEGRTIFGVVGEHFIADLSDSLASPQTLVAEVHTAEGRSRVESLGAAATKVNLADVALLPPVPLARRILCVGTNYADHIAESDRVSEAPAHPVIFTRFPSSLVGHGEHLERSRASTSYDYEGELAIIIGTSTRYATRETALDAIAGYACFMDGTMRDFQRHTSQFVPGKSFDRSGACGPWMVTADEIDDPYALTLTTRVDGDVVQQASTSLLIHDLQAIVSYCSTFTTLEPGDVIATGTPGGVGYVKEPPLWLEPGREVSVDVTGVGTLVNTVIDEPG